MNQHGKTIIYCKVRFDNTYRTFAGVYTNENFKLQSHDLRPEWPNRTLSPRGDLSITAFSLANLLTAEWWPNNTYKRIFDGQVEWVYLL